MLVVAGCSDDKSVTDSGVGFPELRGKRPDDAIPTYKAHGFTGKVSIYYNGGCNPANGSGKIYKQVPRVNSSIDSSAEISLYSGCFDVEIIKTANGHISPAGVSNIKGYDSLVIKFTPQDGYEVSSMQIDDRPVQLSSRSSYRIAKIVSDHNVAATFSIKLGGSDKDVSVDGGGTEEEGTEEEGGNSDTTYTIAASVFAGQCTITPSGSVIVSEGASQSFSIAINSGGGGFLLVDDVPASTICEQNGCNYNFSNVAADHSISVICE